MPLDPTHSPAVIDSFKKMRFETGGGYIGEIVADSQTDTLTLISGVGIGFTIDPESDTVSLINTAVGTVGLDDCLQVGNVTDLSMTVNGGITVDKININENQISFSDLSSNLIIKINGTGSLVIDSASSLRVPIGTTAARPPPNIGQIRFNTDLNQFEAYVSGWSALGGVSSADGKTYILPELSPGTSDDTLWFYTNNTLAAALTDNQLNVTGNVSLGEDNTYKINDVDVLTSTSLGEQVLTSNLSSVGTISTGTWEGDIISPAHGGTGVNNGSNTITVGGNLTVSGGFDTNVVTINNTNVTLPVVGTLATLSESETFSNKTITESHIVNGTINNTTIGSVTPGTGTFTTITAAASLLCTDTSDATSIGLAPVVINGGASIAKTIYVGSSIIGAGAAVSSLTNVSIDGGFY